MELYQLRGLRRTKMFKFYKRSKNTIDSLITSKLFNEKTFYAAFNKDLEHCKKEVIIESPYITTKRINSLLPILSRLNMRGIRVVVNTRNPIDHEDKYMLQAEDAVKRLQENNVLVLFTGGHHRKLAIVDRSIIWEGSLNILSQNNSCEIMRRIKSEELTKQMIKFLHIKQFY